MKVRKNTYYDSVTLMIISKDVKNLPGISEALVGMGTDLNREIAGNLGLDTEGFEEVTANDFFWQQNAMMKIALKRQRR